MNRSETSAVLRRFLIPIKFIAELHTLAVYSLPLITHDGSNFAIQPLAQITRTVGGIPRKRHDARVEGRAEGVSAEDGRYGINWQGCFPTKERLWRSGDGQLR